MRLQTLIVITLVCSGLSGCAMPLATPGPDRKTMEVNGASYSVGQLTSATWTAIPAGPPPHATDARQKNALVKAVETASGCKVTDSDFGATGTQFNAQVMCRSSPARDGAISPSQ